MEENQMRQAVTERSDEQLTEAMGLMAKMWQEYRNPEKYDPDQAELALTALGVFIHWELTNVLGEKHVGLLLDDAESIARSSMEYFQNLGKN
jgi:hypothetical protein